QRSSIFPGIAHRAEDRCRVFRVGEVEADDTLGIGGGVGTEEPLLVRVQLQDRQPVAAAVAREGLVDLEDPRQILGTLDRPREPEDAFGIAREQRVAHSSTQVSFDPPPCEELTISEPWRSATRVSPPGNTQVLAPVI